MNRFSILAVVLLGLTGCATVGHYQETVSSWHGAHAQDLFSSWGYPDVTEKAEHGSRLYVYNTTNNASIPTPDFPGRSFTMTEEGNALDPEVIEQEKAKAGVICRTWFEVNRSNRIVNGWFKGPSCAVKSKFMHLMGNPKLLDD